VYADDANLLDENIYIIKQNSEALLEYSKKVGTVPFRMRLTFLSLRT
jgi:hypothetical protein